MKTIVITICLLSVLQVRGDPDNGTFVDLFYAVGEGSLVLERVTQRKWNDTLALNFPHSVIIGPRAFENVTSESLALALTNSGILSLKEESLGGLKSRTLYIHNASIILPEDLIVPATLKVLVVDSCETPKMLMGIPQLFTDVEELNLYNNNISVIPSKAFTPMKNLKKLGLVLNNISTLEPGCFNGLNELLVLNLSNNKLTSLPPGVFNGLPKLKHLYVENCDQLTDIDINAFRGLSSLGELWLQNNSLQSLKVGMFDELRGLAALLLESNDITHIPKGVFNKVKTLRVISLKNTRISRIEPNAFSVLNLESLDLSGGMHREVLESAIFTGLTVEDLYLRQNGIQEIEPHAWDGLFAETVNLNSNNLTKIFPEYFAGLNTTTLYLLANGITEIAPNAFKNTQVKEIDLRNNSIKTVEKTTWGLPETVKITIE